MSEDQKSPTAPANPDAATSEATLEARVEPAAESTPGAVASEAAQSAVAEPVSTPESARASEAGAEESGAAAASAAPSAAPSKVSPSALAKRAFALAEEDELEKVARTEEAKLEERRDAQRKAGLEGAAQRRLEKIGTKPKKKKLAKEAEAAAAAAAAAAEDDDEERVVVAKPLSDPLLDRAARLGSWARSNTRIVAYAVAAAALGLIGTFGYLRYQEQREIDASAALSAAVTDEGGVIGDPDKKEDSPLRDPRPIFKTEAARRESALAKYRAVGSNHRGTGAATLARLGEAAILLDNGKVDDALAGYTEVRTSRLAATDAEVRGRAFEGVGFAYEQLGKLDDALKTFKAMESDVDFRGFKELARYHQARILEAKGDKDKAKDLFKEVHDSIHKPGEIGKPFAFLAEAADERLAVLDPTFAEAAANQRINVAASKPTPLQRKRQMEQFMKLQKGGGHGGGDGHDHGPGAPPVSMP